MNKSCVGTSSKRSENPRGTHLLRTANDAVFFESAFTLRVTLAFTLLIPPSASPSGHWVRSTGLEIATQKAWAGR